MGRITEAEVARNIVAYHADKPDWLGSLRQDGVLRMYGMAIIQDPKSPEDAVPMIQAMLKGHSEVLTHIKSHYPITRPQSVYRQPQRMAEAGAGEPLSDRGTMAWRLADAKAKEHDRNEGTAYDACFNREKNKLDSLTIEDLTREYVAKFPLSK